MDTGSVMQILLLKSIKDKTGLEREKEDSDRAKEYN
jgi:hypothetical protein